MFQVKKNDHIDLASCCFEPFPFSSCGEAYVLNMEVNYNKSCGKIEFIFSITCIQIKYQWLLLK